ncbi:TonB-dependent receptor [Aquimarina mytili]|uniref:Carboxypeptidase-like regulatory domain-containing protein n=1 Tax=Aquimarina mytili TaxID=874423 RepID=A0A937DC16_9FLAO|nr:carboxypeptidase-like regulatory domain-containing protein [Aquimarina mytili]MBL0684446.1 carboxypeptidase-like regulatory domain-containing protein [Aquimarina mytili]
MNFDIKTNYFVLIFLLLTSGIWAQQKDSLITISFKNVDLHSVLNMIEEQTDYHFYYIDSWLQEYNDLSGDYDNALVTDILEDVFKNTVLNFYVMKEGKIILTQNNIIYNNLPDGFFGKRKDSFKIEVKKVRKTISPVFATNKSAVKSKKIETIRIGKALRGNLRQKFTLSGYVQNIQTKKPLPSAVISVEEYDTKAITDSNGFYEIELNVGLNTIEITSLGMENFKKKVIIYSDGRFDAFINEKIEQLDEVLLEGKINDNVEEVVTKTKIDVEESKNIPLALGERDVLKVATALPGITTAGEGAAGYNVRGGKADQNLILLDDAVVYNPQHFFGIFSALNPFAIGDVNIYKNSIPAEYGGRLSSVFDITTKDASVEKFKGEASIGPVTGNVLLETPVVKNKSGLMVGGRGAYANWILSSLDDESLKNSEASFYDVVAKYNHQITEKSKVEATAYLSRDDFSITSDSLYIYGNRALSLRWDYRFNQKNTGKLALSNSEYKFDIEFDGQSNDDFELGYSIEETELKLQFKYLYSDKLNFDYGVSSKLYTVRPGKISPKGPESIVAPFEVDKERGLESGIFLTSEIDITKKLSLSAGIRYSVFNALGSGTQNIYQEGVPRSEGTVEETLSFDENEIIETYGGPEFRVSGRYLLGEDLSIKASYNKTFQYIHTLSNNTTVSPIDTWKLSDLNIEPQSSQQYALGAYKNFDDNAYELSLEGFYKESKNILDFKTGAEILLNENVETEVLQGNGKAYGVEVLLKKQKGKLYGWLGYTYSRSLIQLDSQFRDERVNNGDFFSSNFDKPHDFSLVANYKLTRRFSLSTNFVYQTGRPITFPIGSFTFNGADFTVFSERNKFRIPDFYRLDIGFNIEGNHKKNKLAHSFWTISIYNVLGRNNPFSVFFVTENGEVKGLKSSIFSIPVPSITYNFKF